MLRDVAGAGQTAVAGAGLIPMDVAERMAWARLSQRLWNDIERVETAQNRKPNHARLAREITIALPKALSREAQIDLLRGYILEAYTSQGTVVDWVIHDKGDGNPHAHLMLPTRFLDVDAWGGKDRRLYGARAVTEVRRIWERHANMILEREGLRERVDMRSLADQGIQLKPENYNARIAENAEKAGVAANERLRCEDVRKDNQAYLREHPEHVLTVVQSSQSSFTQAELLAALADRLDLTPETLPAELAAKVTASAELIPMAAKTAEGEQLYITLARAEQGTRLSTDAARLVTSRMAPELVASGDAFETGTGPIVVDVGPVVAAREEEERAAAERARREREPAPAPARGGKPQISIDAVREALRARADDLFREAFGQPVRPNAAEWRAKANEGIAMQMRGEKRGLWRDHTAGIGGDPLDLAARIFCGLDSARSDFPRVLREAGRLGRDHPGPRAGSGQDRGAPKGTGTRGGGRGGAGRETPRRTGPRDRRQGGSRRRHACSLLPRWAGLVRRPGGGPGLPAAGPWPRRAQPRGRVARCLGARRGRNDPGRPADPDRHRRAASRRGRPQARLRRDLRRPGPFPGAGRPACQWAADRRRGAGIRARGLGGDRPRDMGRVRCLRLCGGADPRGQGSDLRAGSRCARKSRRPRFQAGRRRTPRAGDAISGWPWHRNPRAASTTSTTRCSGPGWPK